jgi:hypothetical protein
MNADGKPARRHFGMGATRIPGAKEFFGNDMQIAFIRVHPRSSAVNNAFFEAIDGDD